MTRNDNKPNSALPPHALVVSKEVEIVNPLGLHTRPSTLIAKRTRESPDTALVLTCLRTGQQAQGESVIALLSLGAAQGTRLRLNAAGPAAQSLADDIAQLFARGFDESPP
ncbi:MAG: HPr family phosphocarrier protein [Silvanigrellales bacterium]|nr:HPr family phosphocarrier protein [Silvanigrellales bacterium]